MKNMRLIIVILIGFFLGANVLSVYASNQQSVLKVGFITVGPINDMGWNYAHNQGRLYLEKALNGRVETSVVENVPESAEVERVLERMIAQGNKLIFTTSYGYLEPALRVAARHHDVVIMQCQRSVPPTVKNVGTYFARQFEPMYVAGVVAACMTKTTKLGYIGGHSVPPLIASLNAFTLGARSVNSKVRVQAIWTNSWCDPITESEAAKGLIDSGADVIAAQVGPAITIVKTCEKNGAFSIGSNADLKNLSSSWLTGQTWNWGPLYTKIAQSVIDHTWRSANSMYGMKDGYVDVSSFGTVVPVSMQKKADAVKDKIVAGKLVIFKGPLKDRNGKERVHAGQTLSDTDLASIDWVVAGIEGSIPKGK